MKTRIEVTAAAVSEFLRTPPHFFHGLADAGDTMMPHVQCLYYHSKEGGKHMEYYKANNGKALYYHGNACPNEAGDLELFVDV